MIEALRRPRRELQRRHLAAGGDRGEGRPVIVARRLSLRRSLHRVVARRGLSRTTISSIVFQSGPRSSSSKQWVDFDRPSVATLGHSRQPAEMCRIFAQVALPRREQYRLSVASHDPHRHHRRRVCTADAIVQIAATARFLPADHQPLALARPPVCSDVTVSLCYSSGGPMRSPILTPKISSLNPSSTP